MDREQKSWSNLVGRDGKEAAEIIKKESGLTNIQIIGPGSMVTMDYRTNRIRIHVDNQGKVISTPNVG